MTNKRCYVNAKDMCLKHTHFILQIFNITTEYNAYQLNWAKSENNETFQMKIYKTCIVASLNKVGFMDNLNISQTITLSYYKGLLYNQITLWTIRPLELSLVQYKGLLYNQIAFCGIRYLRLKIKLSGYLQFLIGYW